MTRGGSGGSPALSGFSPVANGFSFANYGTGYANLDADDMRAMFGAGVCAFANATKGCVLTPPAQRYLQNTNRMMSGGHCFGMSALTLMLFRRQFPQLAGTPINRLKLQGNTALQHAIAYAFAWQLLPAVQEAGIDGTPNAVLQALTTSLRRRGGELYSMLIYQPGFRDGHAITPYATVGLGGGKVDVLVYDNNWPGEVRRVHFDTRANTWSYVAGATRSEPDYLYQGNAKTKTISLLPTTPGLGVHYCPFCSGGTDRAKTYNEISLQGNPYNHAHLLMRDPQGHALGYQRGKLLTQIPGARVVQLTTVSSWAQDQEPLYRLPFGVSVRVTVDGSKLQYPDIEHFSLIGQNHDLAIDRMQVNPGDHETINLVSGPNGSMTYTSSGTPTLAPVFTVGLVTAPGNYSMVVHPLSLHSDSAITISDDPTSSTLNVGDASATEQTYDVELTRQVAGTVKTLHDVEVTQPPGHTLQLRYTAGQDWIGIS
jgi:hypothetical protein